MSTNLLEAIRKPRYDGRSKKRKWEERRSDGGLDKKPCSEQPQEEAEKVRRRKFALLMGYSGVNYLGMQRNPMKMTIEEEFFQSLLKVKYINEMHFNQVQTLQFQRAARTDKGVSAVRQVISIKLPENFEVTKINELLPETIRVFGARRVTKGFNSKSQCDARTYMYMLPTVAFADRGEETKQEDFHLNDEKFDKINQLLAEFVGTKNFYNYTSKKHFHDPSATRFITAFHCERPFIAKNTEFAVLKVKGQSFMLHQIRKMVGLTLAVLRGHTDAETFKKTFTNERVNVPRAPGLGLVLDFVHYERYNTRYGADHDNLLWDAENEAVEAFRAKYIYPTIIDTEVNEQSMLQWLQILDFHTYDNDKEADDNKETQDGNVSD